MSDETDDGLTDIEAAYVARVAHEAVRAYLEFLDGPKSRRWDDLPASRQVATIAGVRAIALNPFLSHEGDHEAWRARMAAAGWRFADTYSEELKTHPDMVPFNSLRPNVRGKFVIFKGTAWGAILGLTRGLTIVADALAEPTVGTLEIDGETVAALQHDPATGKVTSAPPGAAVGLAGFTISGKLEVGEPEPSGPAPIELEKPEPEDDEP